MRTTTVGPRIRALREQFGMSARELSRLAGLASENTVGKIEGGAPMMVPTAEAIAEVFGCSLDWMLRGVGKAPSPRALRPRIEHLRAKDRARRSSGTKAA